MAALPIWEIRIVVPSPIYPYRWKCTQAVPKEQVTIGDHLKGRRLERHLFQADLAESFGVDVASVRNWESNRSQPAKRFIAPIIRWLGYNPRSL
jgi:DNA-binding XRE family transcriptional regulator